jgi:hypothetical protein
MSIGSAKKGEALSAGGRGDIRLRRPALYLIVQPSTTSGVAEMRELVRVEWGAAVNHSRTYVGHHSVRGNRKGAAKLCQRTGGRTKPGAGHVDIPFSASLAPRMVASARAACERRSTPPQQPASGPKILPLVTDYQVSLTTCPAVQPLVRSSAMARGIVMEMPDPLPYE